MFLTTNVFTIRYTVFQHLCNYNACFNFSGAYYDVVLNYGVTLWLNIIIKVLFGVLHDQVDISEQ